MAAVPSGVTEDAAAGREAFRRAAAMYWQLPFYRKEVGAAHPDALAAYDRGEPIPDDVVDSFAGVGSPETVRGKIEDYRDAGVTLPVVGPLPVAEGADATLEAAAPSS